MFDADQSPPHTPHHAEPGQTWSLIENFERCCFRGNGQSQIFLDRLFQAFGQPGCLDVGGTAEFRIRKANDAGRGTAFADYV